MKVVIPNNKKEELKYTQFTEKITSTLLNPSGSYLTVFLF